MTIRSAGYNWASGMTPGQPIPVEAVEAAYADWKGLPIGKFYRQVAEGKPTAFDEFYAGARDFGAADRSPRPLFYADGETFQPWQIETANGLRPGAIRQHIRRGNITARKHGKLYLIEPADYEVWWLWKGRRKRAK